MESEALKTKLKDENAIFYQMFSFQVASVGYSTKIKIELEKTFAKVIGIYPKLYGGDLSSQNSLFALKIALNEIYPADFEVGFIVSENSIKVDDRFVEINENAKGNSLELIYTDKSSAINFTAYTVKVALKLKGRIEHIS